METLDTFTYTGPAYFGTPLQTDKTSSTFAYDTSASFTAVTSRYCYNCNTHYYDYYQSTSYIPMPSYYNLTKVGLVFDRNVTFNGYYMEDYICLDVNATLCTY